MTPSHRCHRVFPANEAHVTLPEPAPVDVQVLAVANHATVDWKAGMFASVEALCAAGCLEIDLRRGRCTPSQGLLDILAIESPSALRSRRDLMACLPDGDRQAVDAAWRSARVGEPFELEHRVRLADGTVRKVHQRGLILLSSEGRAKVGIAVVQGAAAVSDGGDADDAGASLRFMPRAIHSPAVRRMVIEARLRHALDRDELHVVYQPQVSLRTGAMTSVEALLRWRCTSLGDVAPSEFIPVAEQTGMIVEIGAWVLDQACAQAARWRREGIEGLRIHVNISAVQLARTDLARDIRALLATHGVEPALLGVEVTESVLSSDVEAAAYSLGALRALGVEISLDDFGTGYSNLSLLKSLPIDTIKIDRSYVHDVTAAPADVSVTRAVITLAHSLQMKVVAEGVETDGQLALLIANRCDVMQGFLFSAGVAADRIGALWRDGRCLPAHFIERLPRERTLLLVDDEENIVASLKRLLRRSGYRIVTALGAAEGLRRLAEVDVDVIVSDQRMPGMTGVEFLRRAKELYPETIRIVLSGYTELQSITDAINEGAIYKFLTKPWEDDLLRANIDEAFRQKEMADDNRRLDKEVRAANVELAEVNGKLQRALASQREQVSLAEGQGSGARDALFNVPVPLIGLDAQGMIAFVNAECARLLPELPMLLGCEADEALPVGLRCMLARPDGEEMMFSLEGAAYRCVARSLAGESGSRGRLLSLSLQVGAAGVLATQSLR